MSMKATLRIKGERACRSVREWKGKNPFKKLGYEIYITIPRSRYEEERALLKPYDIVFLKGIAIDSLLKTKIDRTSEVEAKENLRMWFMDRKLPLIDPKKEYQFYYTSSKGDATFTGKIAFLSSCYVTVYNEEKDVHRKILYSSIETTRKCK